MLPAVAIFMSATLAAIYVRVEMDLYSYSAAIIFILIGFCVVALIHDVAAKVEEKKKEREEKLVAELLRKRKVHLDRLTREGRPELRRAIENAYAIVEENHK